ncbi:MAG TPA: zf-HC2 domain-containing protein [Streptosporangiaceae bacterium]|jgi:anti-sigma factor RsiW|nr:zf-HC2 domain-containing protein [Streptosporangiaceae bacterium]
MSHLGDRLSALIDGELSDAERDRVHVHLAGCAVCRAEAKSLRELKGKMRGLADLVADDALTRRLTAIAEPGDPVPPRRRARRGAASPRPAFRTFTGVTPAGRRRGGHDRRHRVRYVAIGAASCVVVGLGVTAFTVGGEQAAPGPRITPPVEMYSVEHAITTGEVPFGGSSAAGSPKVSGPSQEP